MTSWAITGAVPSSLSSPLHPLGTIRTWGKVVSESPLRLSDGKGEVTVTGIRAKLGDYLVVTGNVANGTLAVNGFAMAYTSPARIEMLWIPAGSFLMGINSDSEWYFEANPQHSVQLSGYWVSKFEITRGQFKKFIDAGGYSNSSYWSTTGWAWRTANGITQPAYWSPVQNFEGSGSFTQTDNHPVIGITYYEAEAFCKWARGRLPTEAEWEKAAGWDAAAQVARAYPWGNNWDVNKCNGFDENNVAVTFKTMPVGSYPSGRSAYGCYDMAGNAWEWVRDWSETNYSQTPPGGWVDPTGPATGTARMIRGCSFYMAYPEFYGCAFRISAAPTNREFDYGIRMVM